MHTDFGQSVFIAICILFLMGTTLRMVRSFYLLVLQSLNMQPRYRDLKAMYKPYLEKYFKFYRALNMEDKKLFERRVQFFIDLKNFIPRGGLREISPEIKALIAGSAIQITYGYPNIYFRHFSTILVYPDKYMNKLTKHYHKGEVNVKGIIVLSIKSLKAGWIDDRDGVNLGLHEMAHALGIENLARNKEFNFIEPGLVNQLKELSKPEMLKIEQAGNSIFRKYGATSFREFFAVATEVFFERPDIFKMYHTEMYHLMVKLFNIDPIIINKQFNT